MAEEYIIRLVGEDFAEGMDNATGGKGSKGSSSSGGKGVLGMGIKLGAAIDIGMKMMNLITDALNSVMKPIYGIVKGIFKMVAELLRPIAEVVVIMLKPVFLIVRPLIQTFKSFMAPFMGIAREFSKISSMQMASGDITGAMGTAMSAFTTMIGPFIVSITSIALQLATTMLISTITTFINFLIDEVLGPLRNLPLGIGKWIGEAMDNAKTAINSGGNWVIDNVNNAITDGTIVLLGKMQTDAEQKLNDLKDRLGPIASEVYAEIPLGIVSEFGQDAQTEATNTKTAVSDAMVNMGLSVTDAMSPDKTTSVPGQFKTGLDSMSSAVSQFGDKLAEVVNRVNGMKITGPSVSKKRSVIRLDLGGVTLVDI